MSVKAFDYLATAKDGVRISGRAWSVDELALDSELEARGLVLTRARPVSSTDVFRSDRMPGNELVTFTTQLATVTNAGVRVLDGLKGIGERLESAPGRRIAKDLVGKLNAGLSLSDAMDGHPRSFPRVYRASVRAGEASGALDTILLRLAKYIEWTRGIRATTVQALIYPAFLGVALCALIMVLLYYVLPKIIGLFPGGRADLPFETRALLAISDAIGANLWWIVGGLSALAAASVATYRSERGRECIHGLVLRLPKVGRVARQIATSRFASTASVLQHAGCDIFTVLGVSSQACGNQALTAAFGRVSARVRRGGSITEGVESEPLVDPLLVQMISVGERTGELDNCLERLVAHYDEEIPRTVKRFLSLLEPMILISAGAVVAFILLAALLPIFSLYESLG